LPSVFQPRLDVLPPAQRRLWPELADTPPEFTLYGGTAIALRLAHRPSIDFDWFATGPFAPNDLMEKVPYLKGASVRQSSPNNLTVTVNRDEPVQLSFFGGLDLGQVAPADIAAGPKIKVGSLIDLAGFKAAVVMRRAELRDYIDVHALLTMANISLGEMLAAASIIYGDQFSPLLSLKALAYHDDAALRALPAKVRRDLTAAVAATDPRRLPVLHAVRPKAASR
jgi:nucleotidyltransferase AbiEii toxin of type IV toxin-antitoxin system